MDHREVGYHHSVETSADNTMVRWWDQRREREHLPTHPDFIDLNLRLTNRLGLHHIKKIWRRRPVAVVRFVRSEEEQDSYRQTPSQEFRALCSGSVSHSAPIQMQRDLP